MIEGGGPFGWDLRLEAAKETTMAELIERADVRRHKAVPPMMNERLIARRHATGAYVPMDDDDTLVDAVAEAGAVANEGAATTVVLRLVVQPDQDLVYGEPLSEQDALLCSFALDHAHCNWVSMIEVPDRLQEPMGPAAV